MYDVRRIIFALSRESERILIRHQASGTNCLAKRIIFVKGAGRAIGGFDEGDYVAVAIIAEEVDSVGGAVQHQQTAHPAGACETAAEVDTRSEEHTSEL